MGLCEAQRRPAAVEVKPRLGAGLRSRRFGRRRWPGGWRVRRPLRGFIQRR